MTSHKPITISDLSVRFAHKTCFENFTTTIQNGDRIALIGDNGSGKSTLLSLLAGIHKAHEGIIVIPNGIAIGYLPQTLRLDAHKTVWGIVTQNVQHIFQWLHQFEQLAQQPEQSADMHAKRDTLLEKLIATDGFLLENTITTLLQRMGLANKKQTIIADLSGGQQLLVGLLRIIIAKPNVLLLDEPTNHLDRTNREKLFSLLRDWNHTAIIVSHDSELLHTWPTKIWDIKHGAITIFNGRYDEYLHERATQEEQITEKREQLQRTKKKLERESEQAHTRAARSKKAGEKKYANAPKVVRSAKKEQAAHTAGKKQHELSSKQEIIAQELKNTKITKTITPTFDLGSHKQYKTISIEDGAIGYNHHTLVHDINIIIQPGERIAVMGNNGTGKSTFFRALLHDASVRKTGTWHSIQEKNIGYIDQHYSILQNAPTPFELIKQLKITWTDHEVRTLLNDFLFSKNEHVYAPITTLSGGEKARLALAYIAAQSPSLLLLDEITNNVDITTRNHIIAVLKQYPGTLLVISHDYDFLHAIGIERTLTIAQRTMIESALSEH